MWYAAQPMTSSSRTFASTSEIEPSARPGAALLRLIPSSGDTKPVRLSNMRMFTTGTTMTAPRSAVASSDCTIRMAASIGAYSVACTPAVRHSTGPSSAPLTMTTGNWIGPDGVSPIVRKPCARCPHSATMPRIWRASFISPRRSYDGRRLFRRHGAERSREPADAVIDLVRRRVAERDAHVVLRVRDVAAREEFAPGQHRHAALDGRAGDGVAVGAVGKGDPHVIAAFRDLERRIREVASQGGHHRVTVLAIRRLNTLDVRLQSPTGEKLGDDALRERARSAVGLELNHTRDHGGGRNGPAHAKAGRHELRERADVEHGVVRVERLERRDAASLEPHLAVRAVLDDMDPALGRQCYQRLAPLERH